MQEKIPEKSAWMKKFNHFWYYYKWPVILGVCGLVFLSGLISTWINYPDYDLTIAVICDEKTDDFINGLENDFAGIIKDANKNGKLDAGVFYIPTQNFEQNRLVELGITQSIYNELLQGETTLVFINPVYFKSYASVSAFYNLTDIASVLGVPEEDKYYQDDKVFGIKVSGNKYLKDKGMPDQELYMTVMYKKESLSERKQIEHDNALAVFGEILKYQ